MLNQIDAFKTQRKNLFELTTPKEAALTLQDCYPLPLEEATRRKNVALRENNTENVTFWREVENLFSAPRPSPSH